MARDLRKRVTFGILIPLVLGMLIITAVTCIPLYVVYKDYINQYNDHMIRNEENTMLQLSKVVSNTESFGIVSYSSALAQLLGSLIADCYYGRIIFKESIPNLIIDEKEAFNLTNDDFKAIGYSSMTNLTLDPNYKNSTFFYYFTQPLISLGNKYNNTIIAAHLTFNNNYYQNITSGNTNFLSSL